MRGRKMRSWFKYFETVLEGFVIGATTGASTSVNNGDLNWKAIGISSLVGGAAGVLNALRPRNKSI